MHSLWHIRLESAASCGHTQFALDVSQLAVNGATPVTLQYAAMSVRLLAGKKARLHSPGSAERQHDHHGLALNQSSSMQLTAPHTTHERKSDCMPACNVALTERATSPESSAVDERKSAR